MHHRIQITFGTLACSLLVIFTNATTSKVSPSPVAAKGGKNATVYPAQYQATLLAKNALPAVKASVANGAKVKIVVFSPFLATGTLDINIKGIEGPLSAAITNQDGLKFPVKFLKLNKNGTRVQQDRLTTSFTFKPAEFMGLMAAGKTFFNVYTRKNPRGEVRGALFLMALSRSSGSGAGAAAAVISDASFVTGPPFANPASSVTTRMTGALFDTFHLRRAALGSEDESWREVVRCGYRKNNPQDIIGYSGCIPTGNPAKITPIVRICVRSGSGLDAITFTFENDEKFSIGGDGGSEHCLDIAEGVRITELTFGSSDELIGTLNIKLSDGKTLTTGSGAITQAPYVIATDDNVKRAKAVMESGPGCMDGGKCAKDVSLLDPTVGSGVLCGFRVRACRIFDINQLIHVALYFSPPIYKTDLFNVTHGMEQVPSTKDIEESRTPRVAGKNLNTADSENSAFVFTNLCPQGGANVGTQKRTQQLGTTKQVTVTKTDQNTLTNGWSAGVDIKGSISSVFKAEVTTKLAYNGMYMSQHIDAEAVAKTETDTRTTETTVNLLCPKGIPDDTTCTWSGFWSMAQRIPESASEYSRVVNHTMLGGGVTQGFLNGKVTVAVQTTYTDTFVQCLVDGVWKSFGMVNNLG